jgi:AraC-like DNA-binding protein
LEIFIKYMVSSRYKTIVRSELDKSGIPHGIVGLGETKVVEELTGDRRNQLGQALLRSGLELMNDKKAILFERIKNVLVNMVHHSDAPPVTKNSVHISEEMHYDYTYLANLFSERTGMTIEHFIIAHKIERVKELLLDGELTLTDTSHKLNYRSVAHLSRQFNHVTGNTPTSFKHYGTGVRNALEEICARHP